MGSNMSLNKEKYSGASLNTDQYSDEKSQDYFGKTVLKSDDRPPVVSEETCKNRGQNCCIYNNNNNNNNKFNALLAIFVGLSLMLNIYTFGLYFRLQSDFEGLRVVCERRPAENTYKSDIRNEPSSSQNEVVTKENVLSNGIWKEHVSDGGTEEPWDESLDDEEQNAAYKILLRRKRAAMNREQEERRRRRNNRRNRLATALPATTRSRREAAARRSDQNPTRHSKGTDRRSDRRGDRRDRPRSGRKNTNKGQRASGHFPASNRLEHTSGSEGHYKNWDITPLTARDVQQVPLENGKAKIEQAGVYLIYAQITTVIQINVTFNDPSRNRVGFSIVRTSNGRKESLAKCIETFPTMDMLSVHSCYTSLAYPLTSGDYVYIENSYDRSSDDNTRTTIHRHGEMTFWGLIKLY